MIEIRSGLRKLEFQQTSAGSSDSAIGLATVEFAREIPLAPQQTVCIVLGLRDGELRKLQGTPQLIETRRSARGNEEHLYRLHGLISLHAPQG